MMTVKKLESVSRHFLAQLDVPIQLRHKIEIMRKYPCKNYRVQFPITENQLETMGMMSQFAEQVAIDYTDVPDSRYVAQLVNVFLFPWSEEGSVENKITIKEDEGFPDPITPVSETPSETPAPWARPALRSITNLQKLSAVRQLFDL